MARIFGYVRVSTKEQHIDRQIDELKKYVPDPDNIIVDKASGKDFDRPNYKALRQLSIKGDTIYVKSLDRLGRNKDKIDDADSCFTKALSTATEEQIPQIRIEIATAILDNSSPEWAYEILHEAYNKETSNSLTYGWGYYALACHETGHWEEFLYALEKACAINPTEAQQALGEIFPPGLPVEDYVSYLKNHPKAVVIVFVAF